MSKDKYLYTYVPGDVADAVLKDGLKATVLAPHGWEKYKGRVANFKGYDPESREDVLRWLDDTIPNFRRSYAISVLDEPVQDDASERLKAFARDSRLIRIAPAARLLAAGVLGEKAILCQRKPGDSRHFAMRTRNIGGVKRDWSKTSDDDRFLFSSMPHYFIETTNGSIPPEYLEEVK